MFSPKLTVLSRENFPISIYSTLVLSLSTFVGMVGCDEPNQPPIDMTIVDQEPDQEIDMAPPQPRCGDGDINQSNEACDDGNQEDGDDCTNQCQTANCGDGVIHQGVETCDDGNQISTDACHECKLAGCGDGVVRTDLPIFHTNFEECDDGNQEENDDCTNDCKSAFCGDRLVQEGIEECDDANQDNTDECLSNCTTATCGDSVLQAGVEQCDHGSENGEENACLVNCELNVCGDSKVHSGVEECDDGMMNGDQARCTSQCVQARCGDGLLLSDLDVTDPLYEECDDGNASNGDGCTNLCTISECGDGIVQEGVEQCDDGNQLEGDGCDASCTIERCGNGLLQSSAGEECDDGNEEDGDGCTNLCFVARCGDGLLHQGVEECDLGRRNGGESDALCREDCSLPYCGDTIHDEHLGEECDEGSTGGQTCNADCTNRVCGDRVVDEALGEACDDGNQNPNDSCDACQLAYCGDGNLWLGEEECDRGLDNGDLPNLCREDCRLPSCGDGIVDTGERCDDGDDDDFNGCNRSCERSWCGNGELDTYALSTRSTATECDDTNDCLEEECEPSPDSNICDADCSARTYNIEENQRIFRHQAARLNDVDRYYFEIGSPSFAHFVARQSEVPFERCDALRAFTLIRVDNEGVEEILDGLDSSSVFIDQGLCGLFQANLEPGLYRFEVTGTGEMRSYYDFKSYFSQEITNLGDYPIELISPNLEAQPISPDTNDIDQESLFHFSLTEADLEADSTIRSVRLIMHSDHLKPDQEMTECPPIQLKQDRDRQRISDLERPSALIPIELVNRNGLRDDQTCVYEASLEVGLYHLAVPLTNLLFKSIIYQWASQCGNGVIDEGETCDVGEPSSLPGRYSCSQVCQLDPPDTANDNICDPNETVDENAVDCQVTCGAPLAPSCAQDWFNASFYQRNVHARDTSRMLTFELEHTQRVQASLRYCTESTTRLSIIDDQGLQIVTDTEGGRDRCAQIDQELEPGQYHLLVSTDEGSDGSSIISYLLEALRFQSLDSHKLIPSMTNDNQVSELTSAFEINIQEGESYRLSIFDQDQTLQCESGHQYRMRLSRMTDDRSLERTPNGDLIQRMLNRADPRYDDDLTTSFSEDAPCYETILNQEPGRYMVEIESEDGDVNFEIQALNPLLCGNRVVNEGEECDDGNIISGDGCTKYCLKEPSCGDAILDRGEECDDGNLQDGDLTCSSQCTRCGDGRLGEGEQCDDGNADNGDGCDHLCSFELIEVINAISHHQGRILQSLYRERDTEDVNRSISEKSDIYVVDLSRGGSSLKSGLEVVLCAQLKSDIDPNSMSDLPDVLKEQLQVQARLFPIGDEQSPQEASSDITQAIVTGMTSIVTSETSLLDLERCEEERLPSEPQPQFALATSVQRQRWHVQEHLACLTMQWNDESLDGAYALVVESNERWQLYRDHSIAYELNLMTWREVWSVGGESLSIATGQIKPNGDALFKLTRPPGAESALYEARTLQDEHFSCPLETETELTLLSPDSQNQSCQIYSRLSDDTACASTRALLENEGDYYVLLRSKVPSDGLNRFGVKLRSVDNCGDGLLDWGEECDDNNRIDDDECSKVCTFTYLLCGNGTLDIGEECDDGNQISNDGCSEVCINERNTLWLDKAQIIDFSPPPVATQLDGPLTPRYTFITYPVTQLDNTPLNGQFELNFEVENGYNLTYKLCSDGEQKTCSSDNQDCDVELDLIEIDEASPIPGEEDFKACDLSMNLSLDEGVETVSPPYRLTYTRVYELNQSIQVYGRLQPFASDLFEIDLTSIKAEFINSDEINSIIMKAMVTTETISSYVATDAPPCSEALDPMLSLFDSQGNLIEENDDFSATNLCPSIFSILNIRAQGAGNDNPNTYRLQVQNLSLLTSAYRLQIVFPDACGNESVDFGEECDEALLDGTCSFCRLVEP